MRLTLSLPTRSSAARTLFHSHRQLPQLRTRPQPIRSFFGLFGAKSEVCGMCGGEAGLLFALISPQINTPRLCHCAVCGDGGCRQQGARPGLAAVGGGGAQAAAGVLERARLDAPDRGGAGARGDAPDRLPEVGCFVLAWRLRASPCRLGVSWHRVGAGQLLGHTKRATPLPAQVRHAQGGHGARLHGQDGGRVPARRKAQGGLRLRPGRPPALLFRRQVRLWWAGGQLVA